MCRKVALGELRKYFIVCGSALLRGSSPSILIMYLNCEELNELALLILFLAIGVSGLLGSKKVVGAEPSKETLPLT